MIEFPDKPIIIGKIIKAYGVYGYVRIESFTNKIDNIFNYLPWFVWFRSQWKLLLLESWELNKKHYVVKFVNFNNREYSMLFNNLNLIVDRGQFPCLPNGEYYWEDIIGCIVFTTIGIKLGYVSDIIDAIIHDILVVKIDRGKKIKTMDCLIPFIFNKIVKNINLEENIIIVDWNE